MSGKYLHFGVVGLGNIALTHARAISGHDKARVSAACSRSEENRKHFGREFDVPIFSDYSEMLLHDKLNAVTICTPSGSHLDYAKKAAEAGKHVVIEKPIEINVERGKEIVECCKQNGVKLAVIYQNRFSEGAIQMRSQLMSGKIGSPVMARASVKWYRDQDYYRKSSWRGTLKLDGGGAVINQAIHTLDLLVWMMGDPESVSAYKATLTHPGIEAEDNAVAILKFKSGALALFEASTSIVPAQPRRIEINGTSGTVILEDDRFIQVKSEDHDSDIQGLEPGAVSGMGTGAADPMAGLGIELHSRQYGQIIDAIINNKSPEITGEESLRSLAVVEAIYRSDAECRTVSMDEVS